MWGDDKKVPAGDGNDEDDEDKTLGDHWVTLHSQREAARRASLDEGASDADDSSDQLQVPTKEKGKEKGKSPRHTLRAQTMLNSASAGGEEGDQSALTTPTTPTTPDTPTDSEAPADTTTEVCLRLAFRPAS